jgi:hypothetical protein
VRLKNCGPRSRTLMTCRGGWRRSGNGAARAAPGASMAWAEPDEVIVHRPAGACDGCGADLAGAADLGLAQSFQQLEIPLITARRIQHDLYQARCGCGRASVAERPRGVPDSAVSIGPDLRALAVYLIVCQHVPVHRCAADRGRDRRAGLGRVRALVPGESRGADYGQGSQVRQDLVLADVGVLRLSGSGPVALVYPRRQAGDRHSQVLRRPGQPLRP